MQHEGHDIECVLEQVLQLLARGLETRRRQGEHGVVDEPRRAYFTRRRFQQCFKRHHQTLGKRQHHRDADQIENGVEQRQLEGMVIGLYPEPGCAGLHCRHKLLDEDQRDQSCHHVEHQMRGRKPSSGNIGRDRANDGGDGGADIGADRECQRVLIGDLAGGQCGDGEHQRGMAGLHDHGRGDPDGGVQQQARKPAHGKLGQVDGVLEGFEAVLHERDPEEQEAQPGEHMSHPFQGLAVVEQQDHAKGDHRHRIRSNVHLQSEAGDQPGSGGRTQIRTKDDADALCQAEQSGR